MKIFIISFFFCFSVMADSAVALRKGENAPFDGILITKEKSKELRQMEKDKKVLEKQKVTLTELNSVLKQQREIWRKDSEENFKQYKKEQIKGNLRGIWGFLVGVLVTSAGVFAGAKIIKASK